MILRQQPEDRQSGGLAAAASLTDWSTLIGPALSRYCPLIGWIIMLLTPALLCHKDTAQDTQSPTGSGPV